MHHGAGMRKRPTPKCHRVRFGDEEISYTVNAARSQPSYERSRSSGTPSLRSGGWRGRGSCPGYCQERARASCACVWALGGAPIPNDQGVASAHMLVMLTGKERTVGEMKQLFASAGLALTRVVPTHSPFSVLEARKA